MLVSHAVSLASPRPSCPLHRRHGQGAPRAPAMPCRHPVLLPASRSGESAGLPHVLSPHKLSGQLLGGGSARFSDLVI